MTTPEIPGRLAEPTEIPTGARRMTVRAEAHGWRVKATYARGTRPGRHPQVVDSLALRMRRGPERAVAVWIDGKFDYASTWSSEQPITTHNATTLRAALGDKTMGFDWEDVAEVPRDRWGRPLVIPPGGREPIGYTRCTTFAGTLEDTYNLSRWQQRMVALGLAERSDLMVSVAAHYTDKEELNKICEQAIEAAKGKAAAGVGTALHKLTDRLDRGEDLGPVPDAYRPDLDAFKTATAPLTVLGLERFVVQDDLKVGGTFDRLYEYQGKRYIGDTKSGNIEYGAGKIAMQLAIYAHSVLYNHNGPVREYLGGVDLERAIIVHLPAGEGRCELRWLNIEAGWEAVQLAIDVRAWRQRKGLHRPFDDLAAAQEIVTEVLGGEVISLTDQIAAASTPAVLEQLWSENRSTWTDEHTAAARQRKSHLHQRSLRGVAEAVLSS